MTLFIREVSWRSALAWIGVALACIAVPADAVPSFARQTKLDCMTCHVSWPELTPTGRQFKLNGYTLGQQLKLPFAGMLQLSRTSTANIDPRVPDSFPRNRDPLLQQASIFYSGKLSDHTGIFSQFSYDGVEHHGAVDNVDLRYANHLDIAAQSLLYGFTLHNNPMMQDVYNTGTTWGFPYASSPVAVTPNAAPAIEGLGQQVAGAGAYALWHNLVYAEFSLYRAANGVFNPLRLGTDRGSAAALKGNNPYWRFALQREWEGGVHSAMIGTYGLVVVDRFPDNTLQSGPTDHFRDIGIDAQYQYLTDRHRITGQLSYVQERQRWNPNAQSNSSDRLNSFKSKITYYYQKKYGVNLGYFSTRGTQDSGLYNTGDPIAGSATGSPNSSGYILELNYLPRRDMRLLLQYTGYKKFNGASRNYDGLGRNARDNNTLYLLAWLMF
jgi:hypothetical protein